MFKYIIILLSIIFSTQAIAQEDWNSSKYEFKWMHVPVVCGTSEEVSRYLGDKGFKLDSVSIGREGANKEGDPAYWVSYYINEDGTESVSAITSPSGHETCMMYRSFDLKKPGTQT
mgnify:FL=1